MSIVGGCGKSRVSSCVYCKGHGDHRDLHVLKHSFPTLRSSDLLKNPAWRRAADLYLQGKSRAEIAEAMGCNLESAGRHLRRARRKGVAVAPLPRVVPAPPPSALRPLKRRRKIGRAHV